MTLNASGLHSMISEQLSCKQIMPNKRYKAQKSSVMFCAPLHQKDFIQTHPLCQFFFKTPKNKLNEEDTRVTVYKVKGSDCTAVYISIDQSGITSTQQTVHSIDLDNVAILDVCS